MAWECCEVKRSSWPWVQCRACAFRRRSTRRTGWLTGRCLCQCGRESGVLVSGDCSMFFFWWELHALKQVPSCVRAWGKCVPTAPNVPLLRALLSLLDEIWGSLKGQLGSAGLGCDISFTTTAHHTLMLKAGWSKSKGTILKACPDGFGTRLQPILLKHRQGLGKVLGKPSSFLA